MEETKEVDGKKLYRKDGADRWYEVKKIDQNGKKVKAVRYEGDLNWVVEGE